MSLHGKIKNQLGRVLMEERCQRQKTLAAVSAKCGLKPDILENIELGRKYANWKTYDALLNFYKVKIKINLIEKGG